MAFRFLSVFIAEGTATKFVDNAPGGFVPIVNKKHKVNFGNETYKLWKHYTAIEDSLFMEMFKTFDKIYSSSFNEDSINNSVRNYWLAGAIKGPAYFVGSELYGAVYYSYGRKGLFEAMINPAKLFRMYNDSIKSNKILKKCIPIPNDLVLIFTRMQ